MKKLGVTFLLCAAGMFAAEYKGVISDSHCGKAHAEASAKAEQCVSGCIKKGGEAVLVSGDQVIKLDAASKDKVKDFYGKAVTINGTMNGDTLTVDSVSGA